MSRGRTIAHHKVLGIVGKSFSCQKILSKNAKFGDKNPDFGKEFKDKCRILSTRNLFCQKFCPKFEMSAGKLQLFALAIFEPPRCCA